MSSDGKPQACAEEQAELIFSVVASLELPVAEAAPAAPAGAQIARLETVPLQSELPTSLQSVIDEAIRGADDDVEKALIEAMRSTRTG